MQLLLGQVAMVAVASALAIEQSSSKDLKSRDPGAWITCEKDMDGVACASNTSNDECNTAVNDCCNTVDRVLPGMNIRVLNTSGSCAASFTTGTTGWPVPDHPTDYASCVSKFQAIMTTCIDPGGSGYGSNVQLGSMNMATLGGPVDATMPSWLIGSKNCVDDGNSQGGIPVAYYGAVWTGEKAK